MKERLIFLAMIFSSAVYSQEITVEGKIREAITGKSLKAKIIYKSYPTGSLSQTFNDSIFAFSIFGSSKYVITATSPGHAQNGILISPEDAKDNRITCEIELVPNGQAIRLNHLIFDLGKSVIKSASFNELDGVVALMKLNAEMEIQLEGHTDNVGNAQKNLVLSQKRVDAVKKYLAGKGIGKKRIQTKAFGGTKPVSAEDTEEARALNRRVEMRVLRD
ncbi:MAG: OmpA family protein [Bacteroidetes bacterium]|nr:OmpA family protein [Bacteroidota bacterium]